MTGAVLRQDLRHGRLWLMLGAGYAGVIVCLSLISVQEFPLPFDVWDKALHFLAYAGLGGWFGAVLIRPLHGWVVATAVTLGIMLEIIQGWSGLRVFEWADMVANALGALAGVFLARSPLGESFILLERAVGGIGQRR